MDFMWRCARCSNHFANITKSAGTLKQEKKCPKCKSQNILTPSGNDIYIQCKTCSPAEAYCEEEPAPFPLMP